MLAFVKRWISNAASVALPIAVAILSMQLPALTDNYTAALLQVSNDGRRDIDQREQSARSYYHLSARTDEEFVQGLRDTEPSNAQSLEQSVARFRILRAAYDQIVSMPPLLQPPTALLDAIGDQHGYKLPILRTTVETHVVQIVFSAGAAIYGLLGLTFGSLIAQALTSVIMRRRRSYELIT